MFQTHQSDTLPWMGQNESMMNGPTTQLFASRLKFGLQQQSEFLNTVVRVLYNTTLDATEYNSDFPFTLRGKQYFLI